MGFGRGNAQKRIEYPDGWNRGVSVRLGWLALGAFRRDVLPVLLFLLTACLVAGGVILAISASVKSRTRPHLRTQEELSFAGEQYDCILVLGCRVWEDGKLSNMLEDRVTVAVELWKAGAAPVILMSGDHRTDAYNEVAAMKAEAIRQGVPSERIFLDHDGYSTWESIANYAASYGGRLLIVTQEYHLYRSLYLAEKYGLEADGVPADLRRYRKEAQYRLREVLARVKDVRTGYLHPMPEGDRIVVPFSGNGDETDCSRPG